MENRFGGRFSEAVSLAVGGEAALFRVRDDWTGRVSALKVPAGSGSEEELLHEFRLLSRLRHPCLIRSLDLARDGEGAAHVLEYVPVVAPERVWDEGGEEAVWAVLTQALRGLRYLHRRGYVHGDVAPGNILVWRDGDRWRATVGDLGLARSLEEAREGSVRGTPGYMAPEVARGEGCGPEADLYGLAATAVHWLDGRGGWDGQDPREVLRRTAAGEDAPRPARRIGPELQRVLIGLGRSAAEDRESPEWETLRDTGAHWGPDIVEATVAGIEDRLEEFSRWGSTLAGGRVATLALRGRVGTGRRTLLGGLARELVAGGWTALWDLRVDALAAEVAREGRPADPVELARRLGERFRGRDLIALWPAEAGTMESRLLQALIAGRADEEEARTVVAVAEEPGEESASLVWLREETLLREEDVGALPAGTMTGIVEDLFAEEGSRPSFSPEGLSPLAAQWLRRTSGEASSAAYVDPATAVEGSLGREWERLSEAARALLSLLAVSGSAWRDQDLALVLGLAPKDLPSLLQPLEALQLLHRTYQTGEPLISISDPLIRSVLKEHHAEAVLPARTGVVAAGLGREGVHPGDLELALWLASSGAACDPYLLGALTVANREGRFDEVLAARSRLEVGKGGLGPEAWEQIRQAAQALGKYTEELEAVERLLAGPSGAAVPEITLWNRKAEVLAALGRWDESIRACLILEDHPEATPADRVRAKLQRAECFWQGGRNPEAEAAYAEAETLLEPGMKDLWLRYAVGRARQAGEIGDKSTQAKFLLMAEDKVGIDECREDPSYLNAKTIHGFETGKHEQVAPLVELAYENALRERHWEALVMATSRRAYLAGDMGDAWVMRKSAVEGTEIALALGSRRMATRMRNMAGYAEARMGLLSSAIRRVENSRRLAYEQADDGLVIAAERLRCYLGVLGGWSQMLLESTRILMDKGKEVGNEEVIGFAEFSLGWFHLVSGNPSDARSWLEASVARRRRMKIRNTLAQSELFAAIAAVRFESDVRMLAGMEVDHVDGAYPSLGPIIRLARVEAGLADSKDAASTMRRLWSQGRHIEYLEWLPVVIRVGGAANGEEMRKNALSAIQKAADLDDAQLRRQFLGFARIRGAMMELGV